MQNPAAAADGNVCVRLVQQYDVVWAAPDCFSSCPQVASSQETCSNNLLQDFLPTTASSPPPFFPATPSLALGKCRTTRPQC